MVSEPANLHAKVFFVWGTFCVLCTIFVYTVIYETKGLTLEAVDELYAKITKAWRSKGLVPTVSFVSAQNLEGMDVRRHTLGDLEVQVERRKSEAGTHDEYVKTG